MGGFACGRLSTQHIANDSRRGDDEREGHGEEEDGDESRRGDDPVLRTPQSARVPP